MTPTDLLQKSTPSHGEGSGGDLPFLLPPRLPPPIDTPVDPLTWFLLFNVGIFSFTSLTLVLVSGIFHHFSARWMIFGYDSSRRSSRNRTKKIKALTPRSNGVVVKESVSVTPVQELTISPVQYAITPKTETPIENATPEQLPASYVSSRKSSGLIQTSSGEDIFDVMDRLENLLQAAIDTSTPPASPPVVPQAPWSYLRTITVLRRSRNKSQPYLRKRLLMLRSK